MIRLTIAIIGLSLAAFGGVTILAYLNLLTTGFSFGQFILFLVGRIEVYLLVIGMLCFMLSLRIPDIRRRKSKGRST